MKFFALVFGSYAVWLLAGGLTAARRAPERGRMGVTALPVLLVLWGLTSWTRDEFGLLPGGHLSFPLSLFGWLALALTCVFAGALCFRVSPGAAWALLGPPALLLLFLLANFAFSV